MRGILHTARLDVAESIRARWFFLYTLVFAGLIVLLLMSGLTESRVMGFTGLSRLLLIYIQLCMGILPIFILLTTVRSVAGDREVGVFEYLLSLPVSLAGWYWGKVLGRFIVVFLPAFVAMIGALIWAYFRHGFLPWHEVLFNTGFLVALATCFLGIGMLVSSLTRSSELAQGLALMVWLVLLVFLDLILLGVMISEQFDPNFVIGIALLNPLQVFRTGGMLMFDPQLLLMGPAAYVILDHFGRTGFLIYALLYPMFVGVLAAIAGYIAFRRGDLA